MALLLSHPSTSKSLMGRYLYYRYAGKYRNQIITKPLHIVVDITNGNNFTFIDKRICKRIELGGLVNRVERWTSSVFLTLTFVRVMSLVFYVLYLSYSSQCSVIIINNYERLL